MDLDRQLEVIKRGAVELITEDELKGKLERKKKLRIKLGLDPTAPDLHLGHTVVMQKLRQFQDLGHQVIFLIGDFTARIGDPSGRNVGRPPLSPAEIESNLKTYIDQASKILDPKKLELRYNSEWLGKMRFADVIGLATHYTLARMMEREDFKKRFSAGDPLSMHELLYPLMQGYDSVVLEADVELGGTDQIFNLLVGRELQRAYGKEAQVVLTMPLLIGTDGVQKMSKSYGNYIGVSEPAREIFGKVMSVSDDLMWMYYELLSRKEMGEIAKLKEDVAAGKLHPKKAKEDLALELVARFHSDAEARNAKNNFDNVFVKRNLPDEIEEKRIDTNLDEIQLVQALALAEIAPSKSEIRRVMQQGGLTVNGEKIADINAKISTSDSHDVKFGKRKFAKLRFRKIT
jgi:tyrosyl-tRNA synthetase